MNALMVGMILSIAFAPSLGGSLQEAPEPPALDRVIAIRWREASQELESIATRQELGLSREMVSTAFVPEVISSEQFDWLLAQLGPAATTADELRLAYISYLARSVELRVGPLQALRLEVAAAFPEYRAKSLTGIAMMCDELLPRAVQVNKDLRRVERELTDRLLAQPVGDIGRLLIESWDFSRLVRTHQRVSASLPALLSNLDAVLASRERWASEDAKPQLLALRTEYRDTARRLLVSREEVLLARRCACNRVIAGASRPGESFEEGLRRASADLVAVERKLLHLNDTVIKRAVALLDPGAGASLLDWYQETLFPAVFPDPTNLKDFSASLLPLVPAEVLESCRTALSAANSSRLEICLRMELASREWAEQFTAMLGGNDAWLGHCTRMAELGASRIRLANETISLVEAQIAELPDQERFGALISQARRKLELANTLQPDPRIRQSLHFGVEGKENDLRRDDTNALQR